MNKFDIVLRAVKQISPFADIDAKTELIDSKILTSLDLLELVAALETEFDMRINEEHITWENFVTVERIVETILR